MSYTITTDVFCDVCNIMWTHGCCASVVDKTQAMRNAEEQGWIRRWNGALGQFQHVCPDCQEEIGDEQPT